MKRALFLIHRYIGLVMCLIMAAWCLSGVVMMYVGYPALTQNQRIEALEPLSFADCCKLDPISPSLSGIPISTFEIEMMEGRPVMRLFDDFGLVAIVDLGTGQWLTEIAAKDARRIATDFFATPPSAIASMPVETVARDQWTVSGEFDADRPLFKVARGDPAGTEIYVSGSTGKVVQETTRRQRGWNWVGSVMHWIYFTSLRHDSGLWTQVIIWTSLLGAFLTVIGLWFGILQIRTAPGTRWSPYRGLRFWHHLVGLVFGLLTLAWVLSGFLSVNPWGLLESGGGTREVARLKNIDLTSDDAIQVARRLYRAGIEETIKRIAAAPLNSRLYLVEWTSNGPIRLDAETLAPAPLSPETLSSLAGLLRPGIAVRSQGMLIRGDNYYFAHHDSPPFPVYRMIFGDAEHTRYYLDPLDGRLLQKTDHNGRLYRWLFEAVHRWDFSAALRDRGPWDVVMLMLMTGVGAVALTGVYMAFRFLFPPRAKSRKPARH